MRDDATTSKNGTVEWLAEERGIGIISGDDRGDGRAADFTLLRAEQRWENEGGAVEPGHP